MSRDVREKYFTAPLTQFLTDSMIDMINEDIPDLYQVDLDSFLH